MNVRPEVVSPRPIRNGHMMPTGPPSFFVLLKSQDPFGVLTRQAQAVDGGGNRLQGLTGIMRIGRCYDRTAKP